MPCVDVIVEMEDTGIEFDFKYNEVLRQKYHALLNEKRDNFYKLCNMYADEIKAYRNANTNAKLDEPINVASPAQISILLYDIMKLPLTIDKRTKKETRGTGEAILKELNNPVCNAVLEYREMDKLINTYIDKLPESFTQ